MDSLQEFFQWFLISFPVLYSPGPANIFCSDLGRYFTIKELIPFFSGLLIAGLIHSLLGGYGSALILKKYYHVFQFLKYCGCVYMIYLSYQMLMMHKISSSHNKIATQAPPSFWKGFALQMMNVKFISFIVMLYTQLLDADQPTHQEIFWTSLGNFIMSIGSYVFWFKFGRIMVHRFNTPRAIRLQGAFYSLSLLFVSIWLIVEG